MKSLFFAVSIFVLALGFSTFINAAEATSDVQVTKQAVVASEGAININTADVQELTKLKGIGEKKAEAIITWRKENGNFKTIEDLLEVKGIGEATLDANRDNIKI